MNKIYITIQSASNAVLKEVDSNGNLVSGGVEITGTNVPETSVWQFVVTQSRYFSLSVDGTMSNTANRMFISNGQMFFTDSSGNPKITNNLNLDMNARKIVNLGGGTQSGDAVAFQQVSNLISTSGFPSTMPDISLSVSLNLFVKLSIASPNTIPLDASYIFYYYLKDTSGASTVTCSSRGVVSVSEITDNYVVQGISKSPFIMLPKVSDKYAAGKYIHFGYFLMNSAGISSVKIGTVAQIASGQNSIDTIYPNLANINPSNSSVPIITDNGGTVTLTIIPSESASITGDFEFLYGFIPNGFAVPTIDNGVLSDLPSPVIQRSSTRSLIINKPVLPAGDYVIACSYRFINPFTVSGWWAKSDKRIETKLLSKQSGLLSQNEMDAVASYISEMFYSDTNSGMILRK